MTDNLGVTFFHFPKGYSGNQYEGYLDVCTSLRIAAIFLEIMS